MKQADLMKRKRLFLAVPLSENLKNLLIEKYNRLGAPGKPPPVENLHITVHFLGETKPDVIPQIENKLSGIAATFETFSMEVKKIILKKGRFGRMVWADIESSNHFTRLVQRIRSSLEPGKSDAKISPHITLSRLKKAGEKVDVTQFPAAIEPQTIEVNRIELWESRQGGKNPVYDQIGGYDLK